MVENCCKQLLSNQRAVMKSLERAEGGMMMVVVMVEEWRLVVVVLAK